MHFTKRSDTATHSNYLQTSILHSNLPLLPSRRASPSFGWYLFYRLVEGRRLSRPGWMVTYRNKVPPPGVEPGHGHGHPSSTNCAQRRLTSLIDTNALPVYYYAKPPLRNSAMIITLRKFITKWSLYGTSSFHFYRWNQFEVIPCLYISYKNTPPFYATSNAGWRHGR